MDFGVATVARDTHSLVLTDQLGNTPRYTAPEILNGAQHSKESDVFAFGMVTIEVGDESTPCKLSSSVGEGFHRQGSFQRFDIRRSYDEYHLREASRTTSSSWFHRPLVDIDSTVLGAQTARPPTDGSSDKTVVSHSSLIRQRTVSFIGNRGSANPTLQMTPTQPVETLPSLSPTLPQAPANLFGRDTIVDDLLSFADRSASLTLFGAGGNGKTAIALRFLHHFRIVAKFDKHRYFMRCDHLVNSLDGFLGRLSDAIGVHHPTDKVQLLSHLALSPPRILVLDGVDSILDPLAPAAVEITTAIEEIGRCENVCLIATSRMDIKIPDFRHIEVPTLPANDARNTFYGRCKMRRSAAVDELLADLDFHPLSIELLASAVRENDWDEAALLEAWDHSRTSVLRASGRQSLEDSIQLTLATPTIRELGTTARQTLEAIAKPPSGVQESNLEVRFPGIARVGNAANVLCKFSLLYRQDGFVKMLSPFRFYFLESSRHVPTSGLSSSSHPLVAL